ncbi:NAD-dependent epimerase/dehydratase family protein [Stenotrophomonas sp. PS02289]|uniref:NAD-dependent epimerase/dehydratase family protein n=1 Tax=Stenotrophomonas sp. PS02289 TaxID=2991422 RepID=UPI002499CB1A|nr:NAD-dependent epimerase/dehydratase family protein [Stenotrophomonas sp. PS02289]
MKILVTGATGLVGQGVLRACQASAAVERLAVLVRKGGDAPAGVEEIVLPDFERASDVASLLVGFDACFYCAGAPPVGTPEPEYRKVTLDATLAVARAWAGANPEGRFLYVSGAYADPDSHMMPLRIKGETEHALAQLPITTVMLRPGGVRPVEGTGTRHGALKPLYALGGPMMKLAQKLTPGMATSNEAIGRAMLALAAMPTPPDVVECAEINTLAGS